jgi:transcriptional regulator with XRE-family HTH domain
LIKFTEAKGNGEQMMDVKLYLDEVGQRMMERRKKLGLTQEALAERSDLTTQFVSYAESGKRAMRPENLMKIAAALGVSTDYLLTGDIIDKDQLLLSEKLNKLTAAEVRIIESIIDECINLYHKDV